jgi:hypothetical protein
VLVFVSSFTQQSSLLPSLSTFFLGLHVNVSVNAPIEGFKRNSSRVVTDGGKKGGKGGAVGVHYARLPGGPEEEEVGGGGVEEAKKGEGRGALATGV